MGLFVRCTILPMDETSRPVPVSPRHAVCLDPDYLSMIDRAPQDDFVVRVLIKRTAGNTHLMSGELVIAGAQVRNAYPLAQKYPLHFRKTYYPGGMHGDPRTEYDRHMLASTVLPVPPPIGCTATCFRSCLLPGTPLHRLSPLGAEPDESNIRLAQALPLPTAIGLWRLAEEVYELLTHMQSVGLTHGDAYLHNFIVCPSPAEVLPIDFERAAVADELTPEVWERRCARDRSHILKLAIYLQCNLGEQRGPLSLAANRHLEELVRPADAFKRAIAGRTFASPLNSADHLRNSSS